MLYYSREILESAGVTEAMTANLAVGCLKFAGAAVLMLVVDRIGRRPLLVCGALLMCGAHLGMALAPSGAASLSALLLFIFSWSATWAGLQWTVAAELLPQPVRGGGIGVATALYWLLSFVLSQAFESAFDVVGESATFTILGAITAMAACFVWLAIPETRGTQLLTD